MLITSDVKIYLSDSYTEEHNDAMEELILKIFDSFIDSYHDDETRSDVFIISVDKDAKKILTALRNADCLYYEEI